LSPSNLVINDQVLPHSGGSTLLWQHLFWFFGHPEVYIAIVPGLGIVSHILITNMRKPMLSHRTHLFHGSARRPQLHGLRASHVCQRDESVLLAGILVPDAGHHHPGHHHRADLDFSLYGSKLRINSASLFSLGFISMFVSGGVSGFFLAQPSIDIMLHATYFVVGHFHMVMGVAAMFGIFAGTYFWFPKMTGRMMNETLGKNSFLAELRGRVLHLHAVPLPGNGRKCAPLLVVCG
jgi:cytochrome c oxidase subunit I